MQNWKTDFQKFGKLKKPCSKNWKVEAVEMNGPKNGNKSCAKCTEVIL